MNAIEFATDCSGWPVVRFTGPHGRCPTDGYVSLLPMMKAQVDVFIYTGAAATYLGRLPETGRAEDATRASGTSGMDENGHEPVNQMERRVMHGSGGRYRFDSALVEAQERRPLGKASSVATIATNFTVQLRNQQQEVQRANQVAPATPHPSTESAALLKWLGGRLMSEGEYDLLRQAGKSVSPISLLIEALRHTAELRLSRAAVLALHQLQAALRRDEQVSVSQQPGLPFMELGCWELTSDYEQVNILTKGTVRYHPVVVGRHSLLPSLTDGGAWRRIFVIEHHPALTMRPVIREQAAVHPVSDPIPLPSLL